MYIHRCCFVQEAQCKKNPDTNKRAYRVRPASADRLQIELILWHSLLGHKLLVYAALSCWCMRPEAASVWGLKLLSVWGLKVDWYSHSLHSVIENAKYDKGRFIWIFLLANCFPHSECTQWKKKKPPYRAEGSVWASESARQLCQLGYRLLQVNAHLHHWTKAWHTIN